MHYVPRILNDKKVFQRLNSFMTNSKQNNSLFTKINHFLYRATCVLVSLERMKIAREQTITFVNYYIKQIKFGDDRKIALSAEPLFEIYAQIPAALSQLVNMQNEILPILQCALNIKSSVPKSFNDAMNKGINNYNIPSDIWNLLTVYWKSGGKYLRDVRDINEHYIALVDYTFFKCDEEPGEILVLLPDNPEIKSANDFTYNREIDAYKVLINGINQLNDLIEVIFSGIGMEPKNFDHSISMKHMGILEIDQERTLALMIDVTDVKSTENGIKIFLHTTEILQTIPMEGKGNIAVRILVPDHEVK